MKDFARLSTITFYKCFAKHEKKFSECIHYSPCKTQFMEKKTTCFYLAGDRCLYRDMVALDKPKIETEELQS